MAIATEDKERELQKSGFPTPLASEERQLQAANEGRAHEDITESMVSRAVDQQSPKKAPGPDRLNFKAIRLAWQWDKKPILDLTRNCIRLGINPKAWKVAKGVVIQKPGKPDYAIPKAYRIIFLLNCLQKIIEKVVMELLSNTIEPCLPTGQFGCRKQRSVANAAACLTRRVYDSWNKGQIAGAILIDVKGVFDHVSRAQLTKHMEELQTDAQLIQWTDSFMTGRKHQLSSTAMKER
jgi:hypothetical protein